MSGEKFRVGPDYIELESGDSTLTYRARSTGSRWTPGHDSHLSFETDVGSHTYRAVVIDGRPVSPEREIHARFPPMLARFRERVSKSPEALRVMSLHEYMSLARENPTGFFGSVPSWAWWALGGVAGAGILLFASNASAAPFPSVRTDVPHRGEYDLLFSTCVVNPSRVDDVDRLIERIKANRSRYEQVQSQTQVPWWFIAAVHSLEADLSFRTHLHNGDPLTARTVQVPAHRPIAGNPPFTWEESALDALAYDHVSGWHDWTVAGALYKLEAYNGWGYRGRGIHSPYLWSFSNLYSRGKYVADGIWDPNAVSGQCGGGTLWRRMMNLGLIRIET